jgi:hypothetical protein
MGGGGKGKGKGAPPLAPSFEAYRKWDKNIPNVRNHAEYQGDRTV